MGLLTLVFFLINRLIVMIVVIVVVVRVGVMIIAIMAYV
jgi:hypothetical protein